jgi:hypothetical protein
LRPAAGGGIIESITGHLFVNLVHGTAAMRRTRWAGRLVGAACLAAVVLILAWPSSGPPDAEMVRSAIGRRGKSMDALLAASHRKMVLKDVVVSELIAGRLTLAAAVNRFEKLEEEFPELAAESRRQLKAMYPGQTFRDSLAQSVVAHCESRLNHMPDSADVILTRLRGELVEFLRREA